MTHPGLERRTSSRFTKEIYTAFSLKGQEGEGLVFSRTLSVGGLSFLSQQPLPRGADLDVSLYLPNLLEPLKTEGRIVHSAQARDAGGFQIGVSFEKLGEIGRTEILQFIEG